MSRRGKRAGMPPATAEVRIVWRDKTDLRITLRDRGGAELRLVSQKRWAVVEACPGCRHTARLLIGTGKQLHVRAGQMKCSEGHVTVLAPALRVADWALRIAIARELRIQEEFVSDEMIEAVKSWCG